MSETASKRKKGLGRGLEVLLGSTPDFSVESSPSSLPISRLRAGKYQPRTRMDEGALNEEIIKTDSVWYVVRLDSKNDETATESKKESLTNTKKDDFYNDTTDGWKKKADIKEETKLIKKIKITDNHSFTIQTPTPTPDSDVTETPAAEDSTAADSTEVEATATPEAEK